MANWYNNQIFQKKKIKNWFKIKNFSNKNLKN